MSLFTPKWYARLPRVVGHFFSEELRRGTLLQSLLLSAKKRRLAFAEHETMAALLKRRATDRGDKTCLYFDNQLYTFHDMDILTDRIAEGWARRGYRRGDGVGLLLQNSPEFLAAYFATQRLGMYAVPINTALVGEGLTHVITDSRIFCLVVDDEFAGVVTRLSQSPNTLRDIYVHRTEDARRKRLPAGFTDFTALLKGGNTTREWQKPKPEDISTILYTSGTTGKPKGVIYRYGSDWLRKAGLVNSLVHRDDDVLYTCLPLFHANALFLTMSACLWLGLPVVLSHRFSASRFWDEVNRHQATVFNAIGAMIPILLKNPPRADDANNSVRLVLSAACPAECWRDFEARFGLSLWEAYSAVDGGQNFIFNFGNAPVGSIGKMSFSKFRIVDEAGCDVAPFAKGELIFKAEGKGKAVEYFHNEAATREKIRDGYVRTGDLVYRDKKGFLYFVGRNTDSMRRKGENVSAFEIESVLAKHPDVLECAAYGVPSELGEQEIMCAVTAVAGRTIDPRKLAKWLQGKLARHALPRYIRVLDELPKTPTHRVIKQPLIAAGVSKDAFDTEKAPLPGPPPSGRKGHRRSL